MENIFLNILSQISEILSVNKLHEDALEEILALLSNKLAMKRGLISIFHHSLGELHADIWYGMEDGIETKVKYKLGEGITGKVAESGIPMAFSKLDEVPFFLDRTGSRKQIDLSELSFICVPIIFYGKSIGTLSVDISNNGNLINQDSNDPLENELKFLEIIASLIASYLEQIKTDRENKVLKHALEGEKILQRIIGKSNGIKEVRNLISHVCNNPVTVLVTGETGTGKELVANAIHALSDRKNYPFVAINCGAIPDSLIESELFGYEKGSFTNAVNKKIGKIEFANKGIIFLDEIAELPQYTQVKLLRVLQEYEIDRIGAASSIPVDIRVIAATNRQLEKEVDEGRFRKDLFYRLNIFPIHVPPLRDRGADILLLADYFTEKFSKKMIKKITRISTAAIDALVAYKWPGNVRELENCIERAVIVATDNVIRIHDLPPALQINEKINQEHESDMDLFRTKVQAYEKELIIDALKNSNGNKSKAARLLRTTGRILQYKIQVLDIDYKKFRN